MKPNILVVGPSGTGKSSSLRNLEPDTTIILNAEQKALPFRGAGKFKMNVIIPSSEKFLNHPKKNGESLVFDEAGRPIIEMGIFEAALASEKAENVVLESLTSLHEHVMREGKKKLTGFELWGYFKEVIGEILLKSKVTNKYVIMIGIDMVIESEGGGVQERCFAIDGAWKKKVEKEFVIVLYTTMITDENGVSAYKFITNKQKGYENCPAKSPAGMLPLIMDNDLNEVIRLSEAYYNGEE